MQGEDDKISLSSKINEIFATTELIQYFTNPLNESIELTILFPIKKQISLEKFVISLDDKIIISKVMPKEKAKEKYTDSISSGNIGFISEYKRDKKFYTVNIGNLKPKQQKIKLNTFFIQMIGAQDMSYEFNIMEKYPSFYYNKSKKDFELKDKIIYAEFEVQTQSKLTRLIFPFMDEETKKNSNFEIKYDSDYKFAKIKYMDNPAISNKTKIKKYKTFYSNFSILFRTEKMNNPVLYIQYNPELKETAYSINYLYASKNVKDIPIPEKPDEDNNISYIEKYEENTENETPGLFIFLIDQSGSMKGKSIDLVKKSLILFMQSLPEKSFFQLIGFGTNFRKYNKEPVKYEKDNVSKIIKIINNLEADLGGTNISSPLEDIYNNKNYSKINLSKNIFLLTDGQVHDREKCINLISNNSGKFRIHALGIGNDFDKILIEKCGKLGKGTSSFVENVENINSVVIDALNKGLRPYITDIKFNLENNQEIIKNNVVQIFPNNSFSYQNEIINYSFILPGKKDLSNLKIKITGKDPINPIETEINFNNILKLEDGEEMSKMIVAKALKFNEELITDEKKEIEFAKKYQILSKNTALFAQIINEDNQQNKLIKVKLNNITKNIPFNKKLNISSFAAARTSANYFAKPKLKKRGESCHYRKAKKTVRKSFQYDRERSLERNRSRSRSREYIKDKTTSNIKNEDDNTNLIMSQDIIEGSWNENNETKKLINIVTMNKFNKIKNKINAMKKGINAFKII